MPNDNTGDLQIKALGADPNAANPASNNAGQAASTTGQSAASTAATSVPASSAPINLASPADNKPVNKRAFNLEADVADASTVIKPEKFAIPKLVVEKYPDLVELIKTTESMDDQEREYWFQILPIMTDDQINKFRNILETEKKQLADLDKEYEDELNRLNEKHLIEWKEFESKEKSRAIQQAEAASDQQEKQLEEDLLAKLSDV
ncbi:hypothetical protein IT412_01115 [Candidatus Peregrinibacteria bacterium]|nr:hypothetical protein [Candidatus Peregrinibacteria bacterium]